MISTRLTGHLHGPVGAAVIDDQPLDPLEPMDLARQGGESARQYLLFVVAWNLYEELSHAGNNGWALGGCKSGSRAVGTGSRLRLAVGNQVLAHSAPEHQLGRVLLPEP